MLHGARIIIESHLVEGIKQFGFGNIMRHLSSIVQQLSMHISKILKDVILWTTTIRLLAVVLMEEFDFGKRVKNKVRITTAYKTSRLLSKLYGTFP